MVTIVELINKLRNPENRITLQAVEELRARGWLSDGSLRGIALCQAQLQGADLMKADFANVDFHQAHLEWSDLSMADLRGTKLTRVTLYGSNLSQTKFARADLYKANLRDARNLTEGQLSQFKRLWGAIMPDGLPYDGRYNLPGDLDLARWSKVDIEDPEKMAEFYGVSLDTYTIGQKHEVEASPA
jgi:uncharacterized protein YjbI with pentapeptide repeats